MVTIKDVMNKKVQTIKGDATIFEAAKKMSTKHISCLIVVKNKKPEGIITRRDVFEKIIAKEKSTKTAKVKDVMSFPVHSIESSSNLLFAAAIMNLNKIKQLPVIDIKEKVIGIITQTDLVRNINTILNSDLKNI